MYFLFCRHLNGTFFRYPQVHGLWLVTLIEISKDILMLFFNRSNVNVISEFIDWIIKETGGLDTCPSTGK